MNPGLVKTQAVWGSGKSGPGKSIGDGRAGPGGSLPLWPISDLTECSTIKYRTLSHNLKGTNKTINAREASSSGRSGNRDAYELTCLWSRVDPAFHVFWVILILIRILTFWNTHVFILNPSWCSLIEVCWSQNPTACSEIKHRLS